MQPQIITVHTLPKKVPDPAYEEHDSVALQAAEEGIVLLKNEDKILPLKKDDEIMLWGAEQFRIGAVGAGRINPRYSISVKWAVEEYSDFAMSESAKTVLFVISRPSGENYDNNAVKGEFYLSDEEEETLLKLKKEGRQVIAVINSGYPMDMRWTLDEAVKAVWDVDRLFEEILTGMKKCLEMGKIPYSMGIDTWAVDFVLLDENDKMLGDAVAYRDDRTKDIDKAVYQFISETELYTRTGIQKQSFKEASESKLQSSISCTYNKHYCAHICPSS